jgi:spore coat protein H
VEFAAKLSDYLEIEEFARFMAITTWLSTSDSILGTGQNYYIYLDPKSRKFQFLPWDLDFSFGKFNRSIRKPWQGNNRFLERIFKVEEFKKLYLARLEEFSETICKFQRFAQQVNEIAAVIRPGIQQESESKLACFDKLVGGEVVEVAQSGGAPGFGGDVALLCGRPIMTFVTARVKSVSDQLAGKSEGESSFGLDRFLGTVVMAAFDANKDGTLTHEEFTQGFAIWFTRWNTDQSGLLTEEQLGAGINRDLNPFRKGSSSGPDSANPRRPQSDRPASQ